jgi:NitT/TauT family transport system substrate-binding protein
MMQKILVAAAVAASLASPALAADQLKVAISQKGFWDTAVTFFAAERGYYKDENLDVTYSWTSGGAETVQAVATRSVDIATGTGLLGVVAAYAKDVPVQIISSEIRGTPETFWIVKTDSPIKSAKDFAGKTIGYSRPGSTTHTLMLRVAETLKPPPTLVSTGGLPAARTQLMTGQIDASWSVPPFNLDLVRKGEARIVFRGIEVPELQQSTIRVNIAQAGFLKEKRDVAVRFMKAYARALDWMYDKPEEAAEAYAKFAGVEVEDARETPKFYPRANAAIAPVQGLDEVMAQAIEAKFIEKPLTAEQIKGMIDIVYDPAKK